MRVVRLLPLLAAAVLVIFPTLVLAQAIQVAADPVQNPGIINIGQAFSAAAAPYINAVVNALIAAVIGLIAWKVKQRTGIEIDQGHRDAVIRALQNQAGSLIADGMVKLENKTITVNSPALAKAANDVLASVPDAAKHFGLTPSYVADRIIDMIPQITAGAQLVGASKDAANAVQ